MNKNKTGSIVAIIVGVVIIAGVVARYVIFPDQFNKRGNDLEKIGQWEKTYKAEHPGATDTEADAAFKDGIAGLEKRTTQYKIDHPNATDAEIDAAFNAAWGK